MKLKYVSLVLALSVMALASTTVATTTLSSLKADKVSHVPVQNLLFTAGPKVLVHYTPTRYTRRDLVEIKSHGFDGIVVSPRFAPLALKDAPRGLAVLAMGPSSPDAHIKVPADQGLCGIKYWQAYWHTRHWALNSSAPVKAIEFDSWAQLRGGIGNCSSLTATSAGSSLQFSAGRAPKPSIDHFEVYIGVFGTQSLTKLIDLSASASSLNMANFKLSPGTYRLVVKEVAIPLYRNAVSNEVSYTR